MDHLHQRELPVGLCYQTARKQVDQEEPEVHLQQPFTHLRDRRVLPGALLRNSAPFGSMIKCSFSKKWENH